MDNREYSLMVAKWRGSGVLWTEGVGCGVIIIYFYFIFFNQVDDGR